jgi:hypothetical protein
VQHWVPIGGKGAPQSAHFLTLQRHGVCSLFGGGSEMLRSISIPQEARRAFQGLLIIFLVMAVGGELYLRSSTPAAVALNFAEHNAIVQDAVGGVEHARLNWIGHIHYDGRDGWASFEVHLIGARTNGTVDVTLQRRRGQWNVAAGQLVTDSGRVVTIADPSSRADQARAMN